MKLLAHKNYILSLQPNYGQSQGEHIAVIIANTEEELIYNIIDALHEHVGEDFQNVKLRTIPNIKEIENLLTDHHYNIETSYGGDDGDTVQLQKTWIYSEDTEQTAQDLKEVNEKLIQNVNDKLFKKVRTSTIKSSYLNEKCLKVNLSDYKELSICNGKLIFLDENGLHFPISYNTIISDLIDLL